MTRDTDKDWAKVAEENPYWGVLSDDRFLGKEIAGAERELFFSSGEGTVAHIFAVIRAHFAADFSPARSLEFGCGVGRMLIPIARRSGEAIGVDIAPRMVELARRHLGEAGIVNARVLPADDPVMQGEALFDFINSFIVLQHVPPERGYRLILDLIRLLRPGGIATLHVSYARGEKLALNPVDRYLRRDGTVSVREGAFELDAPDGTILMYDYDLNQIMVLAAEAGMAPIVAYPTGTPDAHLGVWLYMRKP
jgi:SAM-dependent methyltransferase